MTAANTLSDLARSFLRDAMREVRAVRRYEAESRRLGAPLCTPDELLSHPCLLRAQKARATARRLRAVASRPLV